MVAGAYRATPIETRHAETLIPPMQGHLDQLQARARMRFKTEGQALFIKK